MFKVILASLFGKVLSQQAMIGESLDSHNCMIDGGYTWCESTRNCIRMWETPCQDNYNNCDECLMMQRDGQNIACPTECDIPMPPVVQPMPPIAIDPMPPACPEVMCMMYCSNGHKVDSNGCQMCQCNDELPQPVADCVLEQPSCDGYTYLCPKLTEITNCNEGGIDGYTTFQLSLVVKENMNIRNIYALYGDSSNSLYFPPAYQSPTKFGDNIGGMNPVILRINPDSGFDSWITIGITDGDNSNIISSVGIDFDQWTDNTGISITDGAVFVTDPEDTLTDNNEYIIGQVTVRTESDFVAIFNVQGKTIDTSSISSWTEKNIRFPLISPENIERDTVPFNCESWYDGCNTCRVSNGQIGGCTRMMCFREDSPRCLNYKTSGH